MRYVDIPGSGAQTRFSTVVQGALRSVRDQPGTVMKKFNTCSHCSLYGFQIVQIAAIEVNKPLHAIRDPTAWRVDRVDADLR
ncbi:hypothetical protein EV681_0310 [Advenella incenata]|uniref:Uncharacterized protein n=1 Tax=Advenella incenata TaxID=267800 RepID=A0A4Q7VQ72_9BURK|nr:hypothetical protein EV681_0310 [Advenella incenata]